MLVLLFRVYLLLEFKSSVCGFVFQGSVEPMQIDADPQDDPQNAPDISYIVENPTLVFIYFFYTLRFWEAFVTK